MKFKIKEKTTWHDKGGAYFMVRSGILETDDQTEIELLKGSKNAKLIKNVQKKDKTEPMS